VNVLPPSAPANLKQGGKINSFPTLIEDQRFNTYFFPRGKFQVFAPCRWPKEQNGLPRPKAIIYIWKFQIIWCIYFLQILRVENAGISYNAIVQ
jgi:hypothetical protein